jgi:ABC-2 type transport system permease protein
MQPERAIVWLVYRRELAANARTALRWGVPLAALLAIVCALQPSLADGPLAAKLGSLPAALRDGLGLAIVDFHRPPAYLATNFTYVVLGAALFAGTVGAAIVAKEEVHHTAELLYTRPARRRAILVGKALAVATYAVALPAVLAAVALALLAAVVDRPLEPAGIAALFVMVACVALCFAGACMAIATLVRDPRNAGGAALGLVFGTFAAGIVSALAPAVAWLRWLSPFKWLEAVAIATGGLDLVRAAFLVALGFAAAAVAVVRYERKDLHA